jgi:hypothetical protein
MATRRTHRTLRPHKILPGEDDPIDAWMQQRVMAVGINPAQLLASAFRFRVKIEADCERDAWPASCTPFKAGKNVIDRTSNGNRG